MLFKGVAPSYTDEYNFYLEQSNLKGYLPTSWLCADLLCEGTIVQFTKLLIPEQLDVCGEMSLYLNRWW